MNGWIDGWMDWMGVGVRGRWREDVNMGGGGGGGGEKEVGGGGGGV